MASELHMHALRRHPSNCETYMQSRPDRAKLSSHKADTHVYKSAATWRERNLGVKGRLTLLVLYLYIDWPH